MDFPQEIKNYPISAHLEEICSALKNSPSRSLILTAETGAGKSTVLPLSLLKEFQGKILMTEPRRISVLGIANRISSLLGENCGDSVGYQVHLEKKLSEKTRLEVVTEAILVKQLQEDPGLENFNLVILDEFHERSIQLDLALAFLKEAMLLRDDLYLVIMSATIDCKKIAAFLDRDLGGQTPGDFTEDRESWGQTPGNFNKQRGQTPILNIPGRTYPVDITYDNKSSMENIILNEIRPGQSILVFLPGIKEIRTCQQKLEEELGDNQSVQIHRLHSSVSLEEQKKVLQPGPKDQCRIILSSAIAETSLTIPGVTLVIDSGLSRINRLNISTGMEGLSTEIESEFSAQQRAGRAGRQEKGRCIRLWNKFDPRNKNQEVEILRADLLNLVLECAQRGIYDLEKINWLDSPGAVSWQTSRQLLQILGCIKNDGHITQKGKDILSLGLNPRLASILMAGASPEDIIQYTNYANSSTAIQNRFAEDLKNRMTRLGIKISQAANMSTEFGKFLLEGFPDRLAKKVGQASDGQIEYQFYSGRKAVIGEKDINNPRYLNSNSLPQWLVAPQVLAGGNKSIIFKFQEISQENVQEFIKNRLEIHEICRFLNGKVVKSQEILFGKILISSKNLPISSQDFALAWVNEVKEKGLNCLPLDQKIKSLLIRFQFLIQEGQKCGQLDFNKLIQNQNPERKTSEAEQDFNFNQEIINSIIFSVEDWLIPFLGQNNKITSQLIYDSLYWYLDGNTIDNLAPLTLILANGKKVKVEYERLASPENKNKLVIRPVIEVIIQRMFGTFTSPKICGMKVLLRLLSPASRPLQITDDLENFWEGAWPQICKEMKGRYPKHNWDYKISED
ncbi:MAG: DEAD/DEAH box helicase [Treponema sp.]|nr:DEAD/DEAH box helicase [Treponema sp.]